MQLIRLNKNNYFRLDFFLDFRLDFFLCLFLDFRLDFFLCFILILLLEGVGREDSLGIKQLSYKISNNSLQSVIRKRLK